MPTIKSGDIQCFTLDEIYSKRAISAVDHERDEPKFKCKKGWVVASDKDGNYTPFFVYTRSKDIVWDQSAMASVLRRFYGKDNFDIIEMRTYLPGVTESFRVDDWDATVNLGTKIIELKQRVCVAEKFEFAKEGDLTDLLYKVKLPVPIIGDSDFSISYTLSGENNQVSTATVNVFNDYNILTRMSENLDIHMKNLCYFFHRDFKNMDEYKKSYLFITIRGRNRYID